jgi:CRP-like cAMP-binding protein
METGQCFGELALINNKPRAARVVTITDTVLGVLGKYDYNKAVNTNVKREMELKYRFLKNFRLFEDSSMIKLQKII